MSTKSLFAAGEQLIASALKAGATGVSCRLTEGDDVGVKVRNGALDDVSVSSDRGCAMRVLVGRRQAYVNSASLLPQDLDRMAEEAVAMAKVSAENKYIALATPDLWPADPKKIPRLLKALDCADGAPLRSVKDLLARAIELDRIARGFPGVGRSEGSSLSHRRGVSVRMNSEGFRAVKRSSWYSKGTNVIAERGDEMNSGSDGHGAYYFDDLRSDEECARRAGMRAVTLLGAAPIPTTVLPVFFDNRMSPFIVRMLFSAINAGHVYRKSTFLLEKLDQSVFSPEITIVDEPHLPRGYGSRIYDAECVGMTTRVIVDRGVLKTWVASIESGAKIGIRSTGHASGPSNLSMVPGSVSPEELMREAGSGLLVTGLMGHDANIATGAFSLGVEGFLIEDGAVGRPVSKVTIAGNLTDIFRALRPASDLSLDGAVRVPTCYLGELTVGGKKK